MTLSLKSQRVVVMLAAGSATAAGFLDQTVIGVALPTINDDLGLSSSQALWIVEGYLLPLAAFAVAFGALGRVVGQRWLFSGGLIGFVAGSISAGLAVNGTTLVLSRVVQGVAAAALFTSAQAMVANAFPRERRGRGIAIYAAITTIALSSGPLIGGLLVDTVGWRWVFFINPVLALLAVPYLLGKASGLPTVARQALDGRFDWLGMVLLSSSLLVLVFGLIQLGRPSATAAERAAALAGVVIGIGLFSAFWRLEGRRSAPLLHLSMLRSPIFAGSLAVVVAVGFVQMWGIVAFPAFMQESLGLTAFQAGAGLVPLTVALTAGQFLAGRAVDRLGPRRPIVAGLSLTGGGLVLLLVVIPLHTYVAMVPGLLVIGLGLALCQTPANTTAMNAAVRQDRLEVSGILATARQSSALLGLAVLTGVGSVAASRAGDTQASGVWLAAGLVGAVLVVIAAIVYVRTRLGTATQSQR